VKYSPAAWFENIQEINKTPSNRVLAYNMILNAEILKHLKKPYAEMTMLSRSEIRKEETYWNNLRGSIKNKAVEEIRQMLEGATISLKKVEDILGRQELYQKIISTITQQISADLREPSESSSRYEGLTEDRLRQWRAELFLSYFRDIDRIQKTFRHDVIETYHREF